MKTKTTSTSSKKPPRPRTVVLSDGTVVKTDNNKSSNIKKGKITKHNIPKKPFSTETGRGNDNWPVKDDLDESEFPPPSTHPFFRKLWAESIENITSRENFIPAHLGLFEALCYLRVELRALDNFVMQNGHTYRITTVLGEQRKTYPEYTQRSQVLTQIANYAKLLDLLPKKDKSKGKARTTKDGEEEWG